MFESLYPDADAWYYPGRVVMYVDGGILAENNKGELPFVLVHCYMYSGRRVGVKIPLWLANQQKDIKAYAYGQARNWDKQQPGYQCICGRHVN